MNLYGIFKGIRNSTWMCLAQCGICELPVQVLDVVRFYGEKIKVVKDSDVRELRENESGVSIYHNGKWMIVYDDVLPIPEKRFVIAHELGHILMGHELVPHPMGFCSASRSHREEKEADAFALRLLAPACVLWGLQVHTAKEICEFCHIPYKQAVVRLNRMRVLYRRNLFLTSDQERVVYEQFKPYLQRMNRERELQRRFKPFE